MKLLRRPRERTPAAKAQAQFICAGERRSGRGAERTWMCNIKVEML
jgi:hypothetical protein